MSGKTREYLGRPLKSQDFFEREPLGERSLSWCTFVFRVAIGGVLIYAGFLKAVAPAAEFAGAIEAYHLLPHAFVTPVAYGLPWMEMWVGTFLVMGFAIKLSAVLASGLFILFAAVIGSALARGIDLASCGCFGAETLSPRHTIFADLILIALSLFLVFARPRHSALSLDQWLH